VALVLERTIPTEQPPLVGEVSANNSKVIKSVTETVDVIEQNSKVLDLRDDREALMGSSAYILSIKVIFKFYSISRLKKISDYLEWSWFNCLFLK
jgi:predicted nucleotidyltransferase